MALFNFNNSLKTRITAANLTIILVGMWSLSFYATRVLHEDMERQLGEQQFSTVSYVASEINGQLEDRLKTLEQIAQTIDFAMLSHPPALQKSLDQRIGLHAYFNDGIMAYGKDGTAIAVSPTNKERIGVNYLDRDYLIAAIQHGQSSIGRPIVGRIVRAPVIVMAVPIRDAQGSVIGALSGVTNLSLPNFLGRISASRYGKTGGYLIVDAKHRIIITGTDKSRTMEPSPAPGAFPAIDRFLDGFEGSSVYINPRGIEVLQSSASIPAAGWYIAASLSVEEAFAPIHDMQHRMQLATLFLTLLMGGILWLVLRRQLSPMLDTAKTLARLADQNEYPLPLPITRQDEIGQLIGGFNHLLKTLGNRDQALQESEESFRDLFEKNRSVMMFLEPVTGEIVDVNAAAVAYYGYPREQLVGKPISEINTLPPARLAEIRQKAIREQQDTFQFPHRLASGEVRQVEINLTPVERSGRDLLFSIVHDITDRKTAEDALRRNEDRYRATFQASQDIISISRLSDGMYIDVNQAFLSVMGYERDEVIGHTAGELGFWENPADRISFVETLERDTQCRDLQMRFIKKNKEAFWGLISAVRIELDDTPCILFVIRDTTESKQAEQRIHELAFFDHLTGQPNRWLMLDRLSLAMAASTRSGRYGALLLLDLDNFKALNDTLGHDMGDLLLKQVAQRLVSCVRAEDTVARLGGDEFVVILASLSSEESEAASQAELIGEKIIAALNETFLLNAATYHCTPSIGANLFIGQQTDNDTVLKQADIAMYRSKDEGGNTLRFFDSNMELVIMKRAALEKDLHQAIQKREFVLHYQPQVSGGQLKGAEALVRWQQPLRGLVSPAEFIPLAEETGLILPLGNWVLEAACTQIAAWSKQPERAHLSVAVNVSAHQFHQDDFVDQVLSILKDTRANPHRLKLELTESMLVSNVDEVIAKMFALKAKGVGFSLDDFGTGYSSLSYLKRLPLDQLKIDQSFVRDVLVDPNDAAIAKTIISLADSLGLGVIAEGVETEAQRDFLSTAGCHTYQGYFFSRPLPIDDFERFAEQH
ncbi:MAG: EAL domain-containing protein [Betaproteobacteria bacterium]